MLARLSGEASADRGIDGSQGWRGMNESGVARLR